MSGVVYGLSYPLLPTQYQLPSPQQHSKLHRGNWRVSLETIRPINNFSDSTSWVNIECVISEFGWESGLKLQRHILADIRECAFSAVHLLVLPWRLNPSSSVFVLLMCPMNGILAYFRHSHPHRWVCHNLIMTAHLTLHQSPAALILRRLTALYKKPRRQKI